MIIFPRTVYFGVRALDTLYHWFPAGGVRKCRRRDGREEGDGVPDHLRDWRGGRSLLAFTGRQKAPEMPGQSHAMQNGPAQMPAVPRLGNARFRSLN